MGGKGNLDLGGYRGLFSVLVLCITLHKGMFPPKYRVTRAATKLLCTISIQYKFLRYHSDAALSSTLGMSKPALKGIQQFSLYLF